MQAVVTAAVLADLLFDEFDGKDRNPFREKGVRARTAVSAMPRNPYDRNCADQMPPRGVLQCL